MTTRFRDIMAILSCLLTLVSLTPEVSADVALDLTIEEMAEASTAVVHGTVAQVDTAWNDTHTRIFTEVTLSVTSYLAGQGPSSVRIRQVGGQIGETELFVAGQPRFAVGEEVVVFLEPDAAGDSGHWIVVCMAAGKFTVSFDQVTGERVVARDLRGLTLVPARGRRTVMRQTVARPLLYTELVNIVSRAGVTGGAR